MGKLWETEYYLAPSMFGQKLNRMKKIFTLIAPIAIVAFTSCSREADVTPNQPSKTVPSEMNIQFAEDFSLTDEAMGPETTLDSALNIWGIYELNKVSGNKYLVKTIHNGYQQFTMEVLSTSQDNSRIALYGGSLSNSMLIDATPGEVSVATKPASTTNPFNGSESYEYTESLGSLEINAATVATRGFANFLGYRLASAAASVAAVPNGPALAVNMDENNTIVNFGKIRHITECGASKKHLNYTAAVFNATRVCLDAGFSTIKIVKVKMTKWCTDMDYECIMA